jgi:hypothetical protein
VFLSLLCQCSEQRTKHSRIFCMVKPPPSKSSTRQIGLFSNNEKANPYRKAVEVVHSKPAMQLTLLQAKLGNCLLKNAYETAEDEEGFFAINTQRLADDTGFDSNNLLYLRESAKSIMELRFTYDVFSHTYKEETEYAALFPTIRVSKNNATLRYKINATLRDKIMSPEVYALIDMNVLKRFQRAQSIPLYEHCIRFINVGQTNIVRWETLRDVIISSAAGSGAYAEYKYFKSKILTPCMAEINALSDIQILEMVEQREGRYIATLQFRIQRKAPDAVSPENKEKLGEIRKQLLSIGLTETSIKRFTKQYKVAELLAAIDYTIKRQADPRANALSKPGAYFKSVLENGWGILDGDALVSEAPNQEVSLQGEITKLEQEYRDQQVERAIKYFDAMDPSEQDIDIARYNQQQAIAHLHMARNKKPKAAAHTAFFRWFSIDRWGAPSDSDLLAFATGLLSKAKRGH